MKMFLWWGFQKCFWLVLRFSLLESTTEIDLKDVLGNGQVYKFFHKHISRYFRKLACYGQKWIFSLIFIIITFLVNTISITTIIIIRTTINIAITITTICILTAINFDLANATVNIITNIRVNTTIINITIIFIITINTI